jgi:hypothetical protein
MKKAIAIVLTLAASVVFLLFLSAPVVAVGKWETRSVFQGGVTTVFSTALCPGTCCEFLGS